MPSCSAIDLAKIRRSSKISSWIWSIICRVVTVLGRPGRGASQVEKSSRLNRAIQFLNTMVHVPLMFLSEWHEFPSALCLAVKKTWWQLMSWCYWNRAHHLHASFQPLLQGKTCNSAHEQTSLSNDTINSILQHREVGRAKDLSAPPHTRRYESTATALWNPQISQCDRNCLTFGEITEFTSNSCI